MISIELDEIRRAFYKQTMQGIYETELVLGKPLNVRAVEHGSDVGKIPMDLQHGLNSDERKQVYSLVGDPSVCAVEGRLTKAIILTKPKGENISTTIVYDVVLENNKVINPYFIEGPICSPEVSEKETLFGVNRKLLYLDQHQTGINTAEDMLYVFADNVSES